MPDQAVPMSVDVAVPLELLECAVDFEQWFGRPGPVELEIGCGKGGFLLRRARLLPDRNFLGIEWANEFYRHTVDRMSRWGMVNVRVLRTDARHFVIHRVPAGSLAALHVYHPDPWPKKRHHKRRLFTPEFAQAAARTLSPGGRIAVQSDHAEYFEIIRGLLLARAELGEVEFGDLSADGDDAPGPGTNFEIKYRREGRAIYRAAFERQAAAP